MMPTRIWTAEYEGHQITLKNKWSLFPPNSIEELLIDDKVVAQNTSTMLNVQGTLMADLAISKEKSAKIEGRIGQGFGGLRVAGQILADGKVVGGDKTMSFIAKAAIEAQTSAGFLSYFLRTGIWSWGVPFGIGMMFTVDSGDWIEFAVIFATTGFAFGTIMSAFWFYMLKRSLR